MSRPRDADPDRALTSDLMRPTRDSTAEQQLLERMYVLCAVEMLPRLQAAACTQPHFERYRAWLTAQRELFQRPGVPLVPDAAAIVTMDGAARRAAIDELRGRARGTPMEPVVEAAGRVYDNVVDVVEGRVKLVRLLLQDDLLIRFYDWANDLSDLGAMFRVVGRGKPRLRVLEIGAGTGGTTARALEGFTSDAGERLYGDYMFTDIAEKFFAAARQRFEAYEGIEYRKLDISRDPRDQGFEAGAYDFLIASNASLHSPLPDRIWRWWKEFS